MLVCLCNIFGSDTVERSQPRTEEWVMLKHAHKTAITLVYREVIGSYFLQDMM